VKAHLGTAGKLRSKVALGLALLIIGAAVGGCARTVWTKEGATDQEFRADSYACERDKRQSFHGTGILGGISARQFFDQCMESRGWRKSE
jgi:hypothetical protein